MEKSSYSDLILKGQVRPSFVRNCESDKDFLKRNAMFVVPIQKSEFESLLHDEGSLHVHSDIWLVSNEQRLRSLSPDSVRQLESALASRNIASPFEGFSDEQIAASIKERQIQSPSELKEYFDMLSDSYGSLVKELELFNEGNPNSDVQKSLSSDSPVEKSVDSVQ